MKYIRDTYHVPAYRGKHIAWQGKQGKIVSARNGLLGIRFDGELQITYVHPTDNVRYAKC